MSLPTRRLGKNGPEVTSVGFGLMGIAAMYGTIESDEKRFELLDHIYASGQRHWDTADMYGDSEELIGKWFSRNPGKRETIFLATKFAFAGLHSVRNDEEYARQQLERSLRLLQTDFIDLYYVHRVDPAIPIEKTMRMMVRLRDEGKFKHIGISEASAETLRRAHAIAPLAATQIEYSPFAREVELPDINVLETCKELGIALVAYSPLGRGLLTGQIKSPDDFEEGDVRRILPRYSAENFPRVVQLTDTIRKIGARQGATPAQVTLAWLLKQWDMVIPIPGTKKSKYYDDNMGALKVELTDDEDREIREASQKMQLTGERNLGAWGESFADTAPLED